MPDANGKTSTFLLEPDPLLYSDTICDQLSPGNSRLIKKNPPPLWVIHSSDWFPHGWVIMSASDPVIELLQQVTAAENMD